MKLPQYAYVRNSPFLKRKMMCIESFDGVYLHDTAINLIYDPNSDIGALLYKKGAFESDEINYSSEILAGLASGTVIDVGTNIGLHTISWAKANNSHKFVAFEPTRKVFSVLKQSVINNKLLSRVRLNNAAVSNESGKAKFYETKDDAYNSLKDTNRKEVKEVYEVDIVTLDEYAEKNNISDIRFIKIDTEGFEDEVICGALNVLKKQKPVLFVEIYGGVNSNKNPDATVQRVIELGYFSYIRIDGTLRPYEKHSDRFYNYFFFPEKL